MLSFTHLTEQETQKHSPVRPSPPSAEAVAKARSRTVESLEDKESNNSADETPREIDGEHVVLCFSVKTSLCKTILSKMCFICTCIHFSELRETAV